jgi:hypothetical protein
MSPASDPNSLRDDLDIDAVNVGPLGFGEQLE